MAVVLILMRVLIHNGLSLLATWVTVATLIGLADELIYVDSFGKPSAVERGEVEENTILLVSARFYFTIFFLPQ